jgi:hypothetical protein
MSSPPLNRPSEGIIGKPADGLPEHFEVCPLCGQAFDARLLERVLYHNQPVHDPLPING